MAQNFKAEQLFSLADQQIEDGQLEDAVNTLNEILADDPSFGKAYNHLGWIYEQKVKDYKKAEDFYKLSVTYAPNYSAGYINYAYLLSTLKRFNDLAEHLQLCERVLGINKATLANEWGIMYECQGEFDKAIEKYKEYAALTFDDKALDTAVANIERCKKKKTIFEL
jgi:tetratricopeptide (TPR) repeat protein